MAFDPKRLKENLRLWNQAVKNQEESAAGHCKRCGISLQGIEKEEFDDSYYVCLPCAEKIRDKRGYYLLALVLVLLACMFLPLFAGK